MKSNNVIFFVILAILAIVLRTYNLEFQSPWLDELHSLVEANPNNDFKQVYESVYNGEASPPMYFFILNIIFKFFGYSVLTLRSVSVFFALLSIVSIYFLGKEIFNKKVGIISSVFLTVNIFHIQYSQEGRMYSLMMLTTIISFVFLLKYLKNPSFKSLLIYCFFSTLLIYSHFHSLFVFVSQYLILLIFILTTNKNKILILKHTIFSGLLTLILYFPSYKMLQKSNDLKETWIPIPKNDFYYQVLKDFFGRSDALLISIFTLFIIYVIYYIKLYKINSFNISNFSNNIKNTTFIIIIWILITLGIPFVMSFIKIPMVVNRYAISVLPAIIIIVSIGLYYIKNKFVQNLILIYFVCFSIYNLIFVNKYYTTINKTQFREVANFVIDKNKEFEPIITNIPWHFSYYFKNKYVNHNLLNYTLDDFVERINENSINVKSFWVINGHLNPYLISSENELKLNKFYKLEDNIELFDCWAKHYVLKTNSLESIKKY